MRDALLSQSTAPCGLRGATLAAVLAASVVALLQHALAEALVLSRRHRRLTGDRFTMPREREALEQQSEMFNAAS